MNNRPFTNAEWAVLMRGTHPDTTTPETARAAFLLLKKKEKLLRQPPELSPWKTGDGREVKLTKEEFAWRDKMREERLRRSAAAKAAWRRRKAAASSPP